jgi:flagellar protein FlaG
MALISVTPVQVPVSNEPPSTGPALSTKQSRALNLSVSAAVQTVNEAGYAGAGREVTFSVDQATKQPVIKVIDTSTKEVLRQWPPEYLLQIAADAKKLSDDVG